MPHNTLIDLHTLPALRPADRTLAAQYSAAAEFVHALASQVCPDHIAVAWTGGKDSTLVLDLWQNCLRSRGYTGRARVLSIDTGCKFPEIVSFRDTWAQQWNLDLTVIRPAVDLTEYPVARDPLQCCADLKIHPLQAALEKNTVSVLLTGIRADEHPSRAGKDPAEILDNPPHIRAHPLLYFTELDVWAATMDKALPYCPLYDQGYRSLGCMPCTQHPDTANAQATQHEHTERTGRNPAKEARMEQLQSLGYF